jgi:hypothetical protein
VTLGVVRQSTANPLDVSQGVRAMLPQIESTLPAGMKVEVAYDSSIFIDRSIKNVFRTIGEAVVLVILVIFFFLRSVRSTLIPLVTIPVSLIGAFGLMYAFGFSVNTLTLLAMVLAIGLVVDDAIVVLENIFRHVEKGMSPVKAAFQGSREIAFAVIAMTLTLARSMRRSGSWRAHRPALHRVRPDAGRRSPGLGVRRADPLADDVLQAPAPPAAPFVRLQRHRVGHGAHDSMATGASCASPCGPSPRSSWWPCSWPVRPG